MFYTCIQSSFPSDVVIGLSPWSSVVFKDQISVLGPGLGPESAVFGPVLGLEGQVLGPVLGLEACVIGLGLGLKGQVFVNINGFPSLLSCIRILTDLQHYIN